MLAIDHRGSFKKIINSQNPETVTDKEIVKTKSEIIGYLSDQISGVLLDVKWGLPAYKLTASKNKPTLLAIEKTGYQEKPDGRITELEYNVNYLKSLGAKGIKLLIYFNPYSSTATQQLQTTRSVYRDCQLIDLPLFLEIVTYHTSVTINKNNNLVVESVKRFLAESIHANVFKLEYPGNKNACRQINGLLKGAPWILLTRGENFEIFKQQLQSAVQHGCQGFLAGRALWQELGHFQGEERRRFLRDTVSNRFKEIAEIATNL